MQVTAACRVDEVVIRPREDEEWNLDLPGSGGDVRRCLVPLGVQAAGHFAVDQRVMVISVDDIGNPGEEQTVCWRVQGKPRHHPGHYVAQRELPARHGDLHLEPRR